MSTVPDFMPNIRSGYQHDPADGGCVMQVTAYLYNQGWTDHPECVDASLTNLAICINDSVGQDARRGLLAAVTDLMGTATLVDDLNLEEFAEDEALEKLEEWVGQTIPYGLSVDDDSFEWGRDSRWSDLCEMIQMTVNIKTGIGGEIPNIEAYRSYGLDTNAGYDTLETFFGKDVADAVRNAPADWEDRQVQLVSWFVAFVRKYREVLGDQADVREITTEQWRTVAEHMAPA